MLEENYLNIKSGSRFSEDTMTFVVEDLKFHLTIKIKLDNIEVLVKELASGANYISKKTLSEFLKNEIFKGSQNSQTIKEIIFKILINNLAKISFNNNKCYLNLGIKNPASSNILVGGNSNTNKELNFVLELTEDTDVNSLVQNFLKKIEELEKENKILKLDLEKIRGEFAHFKEEKNKEFKELKENETERKNEIHNLKGQMEKLAILVSSAINNNTYSGAGSNNNIVASGAQSNNFIKNNEEYLKKDNNKILNNFASNNSKSSQNLALNNLFSTSPVRASIYPSDRSPNLDANREKFKSSDNVLENQKNNSASPNKFFNNLGVHFKSNSSNNIYDNILMQNILNPKKINLNNVEGAKSPTTDSPPISIRKQVEEMNKNNINNNNNNRNSRIASPSNELKNKSISGDINVVNSSPNSINNSSSNRRITNFADAEKPGSIVGSGNNDNNNYAPNTNQTAYFFNNFTKNNQNDNTSYAVNNLFKNFNVVAASKNEEVKNSLRENNNNQVSHRSNLVNKNYNLNTNNYKNNFSQDNVNNHTNIPNNNLNLHNINTNNPLFTFSNNMQTPKSIQGQENTNINDNHNNQPNNNIMNNSNNNIKTNNLAVPVNTQILLSQKPNELLHFLSENPVNIPIPYKYMDLILKKPMSCFKLENNIKFFYQVNKGEISDTTLWSPFDEEECILLELHYPNYLIGGPCEVYMEKLQKIINFKYMMLVDVENPENHIHIKRSLPNNLNNVVRKSRYNFEDILNSENLKHKVLPSLNVLKDYGKYQEYFVCFEFSFIKNHNFEVKIPKKFEYLYLECIRKLNYGAFLVSLREEVETLRSKLGKRTSIYFSYLDNLENSPKFFQIIIQMYTEDGFLSNELNKVLRKPTLERLDRIKHFYLAVLVSLTYCSLNVRPKLTLGPFNKSADVKNKSNGFNGYNGNNADRKEIKINHGNNLNSDETIVKTEESFGAVYKKTNQNDKNDNLIIESSVLNSNGPNTHFPGNERNYFVYSPYRVSTEELGFYKDNKYNIMFFDEFISATPNKDKAENYLKAFKSIEQEENLTKKAQSLKTKGKKKNFNNSRKENPNNFSNGNNNNYENEFEEDENRINNKNDRTEENININKNDDKEKLCKINDNDQNSKNRNKISVIFEIEIPYYMLESENMHIDTVAFAYENNFSLYPQDEEVILKSGSILMVKDIVQNSKEVYQYTVKLVALSFSWKGFFDCLAYNQTTKEINLNKNGIGNFRKSVKYLCEALVKNKNIEKLCLRENHFGENYESMRYLANLISISNFASSATNNNNQEMIERLRNMPKNLYTNLLNNNKNKNIPNNDNNIDNNIENLKLLNFFNLTSDIYLNSIPKLKIVDLGCNAIGKDARITRLFCEALSINQNLTDLDLSHNYLCDIESAKALSSALIANKFLKKLSISANNLGSNLLAMNYISEAILYNSYITDLSLSDNNLGERADIVKTLADALSRNKTIKSLDLSSNAFGINSISVRYLAEGLILNENILELDLKNNLLGNLESMSYLFALLEKNANLEVLDLSKNKFGVNKESYTLLGEAISLNRSIHTLNLSNNNLNTHLDYLRCLLDSLRCNTKLRKISLSYNSLSNNEDFKMFVKSMLKDRNINYLGTSEI